MTTLTVRSNRHWRSFCYRNEVPVKVLRSQFDWMIPKEIRSDERLVDQWCKGLDESSDYVDGFFRYRGYWYHTSDFMRIALHLPSKFAGWHGAHNDSAFSGTIIKLADDGEMYQIATFCS
jgi:hypothetical protein